MELWGTLRKRIGGSIEAASEEYVNKFFEDTESVTEWNVECKRKHMDSFIEEQKVSGRRVVVVTSGSSCVPLEENTVTFMDSPTTGNRGAACAEYFLKRGYGVIFLHRSGSLKPFSRHFSRFIKNNMFLESLSVDDTKENSLSFQTNEEKGSFLKSLLSDYKESSKRLLLIEFSSVQQYLFLLRSASQAISAVSFRGMMFLAAAVLNYYVPSKYQQQHRDQTDDDYSVSFVRIPNLIHKMRNSWCPRAYIVTFKLETDPNLISESSHRDLEKLGVNMVVGNTLATRRECLSIVTEYDDASLKKGNHEEIEELLIATVVRRHQDFSLQRTVLQNSRQLLLLSAKFSMMRLNDNLNEDALGNKNIPFQPGVRIRSDRRLGEKSPVFEFSKIYTNSSKSARAHIWKRINSSQKDSEKNNTKVNSFEVLVAFSPAGTPETIRDLWGDFWSGWADQEVAEIKTQLSQLTLSNALQVVTAPLTGDYSSATALMNFVWSKVGAAWSDGESTRIRQTLQNVLSIGFDRSLVEVPMNDHKPNKGICRANTITLEDVELMKELSEQISRESRFSDDTSDNRTVRVHKTLWAYFSDMIDEGIIDELSKYLEEGGNIIITGYSMGGMLGQLLMLKLGEHMVARNLNLSKVQLVGFGTPRVGDEELRNYLHSYYSPSQLLNVMHPLDTVHAFPPSNEGYVDTMMKIFLKEDGWGIGRRTASTFSILPTSRAIDKAFEKIYASAANNNESHCEFCKSKFHNTKQHRCRYCTQRGHHRGASCPNKGNGCSLCGNSNHCTGEHKCKVCSQYGHRGRDCHKQSDVGTMELISYFRFHNFLYYNANIKKSVEFSITES